MSPLDEELHHTLHGRAAALTPAPDPMQGIERRAAGIRRRRVAATVVSGALLIAAAAITVPSLLPGDPTGKLTPATQGPTPTAPQTTEPAAQFPANLLQTWPQRGTANRPPSVDELVRAFADGMNRSADVGQVRYRDLFVGDTGKGEAFTVGQAWFDGEGKAYNVSYTTGTPDGPVFALGKPTRRDPVALAFLIPNLAGMSDLLVVVPQPGTGQVLYSPGSDHYRPITGQDRYDGVVVIDRPTGTLLDQLELLNGDGDADAPMYKGFVEPFLCDMDECPSL